MATIKKPVKKMQKGGKVKIKIKIKPDRNSNKNENSLKNEELSRITNEVRNKILKNQQSMKASKDTYSLDKASKEAGYEAAKDSINKISGMKKGGAIKKMQKGGKATKTEYTSEQNAKDWAKKEREMTGSNAPKISSKENNENWAKRERIETMKKNVKNALKPLKKGGVVKAKNGKSFPDLNKDRKITKADILKGRGVIAKKGAKLKKQAAVAIAMKKAGKAPKKMQYGGEAASMVPPMMKKGGKIKKAQTGTTVKTPSVNPPAGYTKGSGYKSFAKSGTSMKKCKYGCK